MGCETNSPPSSASAANTEKSYVITAATGNQGSIFPKGDILIKGGESRAFVITPNSGYQIEQVYVDGTPIGAVPAYTFDNVLTNHSISAVFSSLTEEVAVSQPMRQRKSHPAPAAEPMPVPEVAVTAEPVAPQPSPVPKPVKPARVAPAPKPVAVAAAPKLEEPTTPAPEPPEPVATPPAPIAKIAKVESPPAPAPAPVSSPVSSPAASSVQPVKAAGAVPVAKLNAISDPVAKGLAIAQAADERDSGFHDYKADMVMILTNQQGDEVQRFIEFQLLEVANDGDKSLTLFNRPADIKGTALLTFSHKQGNDEQWLYLPAIKRVKRISSSNQSGSFMGSEFSYEDMSSQEVEKYSYEWLRDESAQWVINARPTNKDSGYSRQERWYDQAHLRLQKINYYDLKDALLKTLTFSDYQLYLGRYWRAGEMLMVNHQTGKKTLLQWRNYQFQSGLSDQDFTQNSLQRAR